MKVALFLINLFTFLNTSVYANNNKFKDAYNCFEIRQVKVDVEYDRVQRNSKKFNDVCELGLRITSTSPNYSYITRNWRTPAYCKKFMSEWEKLKKENRTICIAAYLSYPEKKKYQDKEILEQSGFWEVIKSENWCHTYFSGNCQEIVHRTESF
jgi:hypothetical protein